MKPDLKDILDLAKGCALKAGDLIKDLRDNQNFTTNTKSNDFDLVTTSDLKAEELIVNEIKKAFPTHLVMSEESYQSISSDKLNSESVWVIDPIDGTVNYAHGCLHVCVSIAYAYKGEVLVGVVYAPFLNELFIGVKGQGATLNDKAITVSKHTDLKDCLISTGFPYDRSKVIDILVGNIKELLKRVGGIRRAGAAAIDLCWVACGRLGAHYEIKLCPWDVAAAKLIACEAGAKVGFLKGEVKDDHLPEDLKASNTLIAAPGIFEELQEILQGE